MNKHNQLSQIWLVTRWEFAHFFKWKQEVISKVILVAIALFILLWEQVKGEFTTVYQVAIPASISLENNDEQFNFVSTTESFEQLKQQMIETETWHAIVTKERAAGSKTALTVYSLDKQSWLNDLNQVLNQQFGQIYANTLGLKEEQVARLKQPTQIENRYFDDKVKSDENVGSLTATGMIILLAIGVFTSFGQLFVSITGEKQQRVTEQLYSCVSPQTWIDGKIFGQILHAIKAMFTSAITALLGYAFFNVVLAGNSFDLSIIEWSLLPWLLIFSLLGLYFCTAFIAAIAAAIDDPNHSAKTSIMLLPLVPIIITFLTMDSPSGWALNFLSYFPLTSFAAMPVKMSLIDVPIWQPIISALLSLALCLWMRKSAARLFKMGMTMYGKEPGVKDMMKWALSEK
ncbi:ABC transporter permease [Thalassotalea ganghwensis]